MAVYKGGNPNPNAHLANPIAHAQMIEYIQDNLRLEAESHHGYYGERGVEIKLMFDGKELSSVQINFPRDPGSSY